MLWSLALTHSLNHLVFGIKHFFFHNSSWPQRDGISDYDIWGAACTEVEIDVLTGEKNIRRVDIIEDCGDSPSPEIDVGQIEGAIVMAIGLWTSEQLKYDPVTGRLLTRDTWVSTSGKGKRKLDFALHCVL